jgi:hypothetical protein
LGKLWTDEEKDNLKEAINEGLSAGQIFKMGLIPGRSFRSIKGKRTEVIAEIECGNLPKYVPAPFFEKTLGEVIKDLKEYFNIEDELEEIIELKEAGYTYSQITDNTSFDFNYIKNKMKYWARFKEVFDIIFDRYPDIDEVFGEIEEEKEEEYEFEKMWDLFCDGIGRVKRKIQVPEAPNKDSNISKSLIIQDLHVPFQDEEFLIEIMEKHGSKVDRIIIGGDFLDCHSVSVFPKYENISLEEELTEGVKVLQYLLEYVPEIILIEGNHERRIKKSVAKNMDPNLAFLMETNLLKFISKGLAKEVTGAEFDTVQVIDQFYYQIGDAIIGHPQIYSKVDLKGAIQSYEWFKEWSGRLDIEPFRFVSHAHTHKSGITYRETDGQMHMIIETGSLCETMDYQINADSRGKYTPHQNGYVILVQEDGKTNFDETRLFVQDIYG